MQLGDWMVCLKPMDASDLPWVLATEQKAYAFPWSRRGFELALDQGLNAVFLSDLHDAGDLSREVKAQWQPVGYAVARAVVDEIELLNFCIHPDWQRRGLGQAALAALLARWRAQGWTRVLLEVRPSNPAMDLYQKLGFTQDGMRPGYYPTPTGEKEPACLMSVQLD